MKLCNKCKIEKEDSCFYVMGRQKKDKTFYLCSKCKECCKEERLKYQKDPIFKTQQNLYRRERRKNNKEHRDKVRQQGRESCRRNHIRVMLHNAKNRAKKLNIEFSLTKEDIIIPNKCPLLETPFIVGTKENYLYTPTIDRIDINKGYTKDNIKIITMLANSMKNAATFDQLLTFSKNIKHYIKI